MIGAAAWGRLRGRVLNAHPLCVHCAEDGRIEVATEVHHVRPVEDGLTAADRRRLMFDECNLVALCHRCHVRAHVELGRGGERRASRVHLRQLEQFKERFLQ